jgi:hypothetical protein
MADPVRSTIAIPDDFVFGEVSPKPTQLPVSTTPALGPLAAFVGTFAGNGFNTIFRPQNAATPTPLPVPVPGSDNILELNLTSESLAFSPSLGSVPNRGEVQGDIFLNGVPYLQSIKDITNPAQPVGIHVEPGIWMIVPSTTNPQEPQSLVRMASIPHGTTVNAQGTWTTANGAPTIAPVSITPTITATGAPVVFPSQTAATANTPRIPQDLTPFIAAGTITQAILGDPNTVIRNHIAGQTIVSTTTIVISTSPAQPLFGGGTDNIAFLLGNPQASAPNADAIQMRAVFWIETVEEKITVPIFRPGQPPLLIRGTTQIPGQPVPRFQIKPAEEISEPVSLIVRFTQIQYSQLVLLNFNGLTWPHVSVATLVPSDPVPGPPGWN